MYDQRVALVVGTRPEAIKLAPLTKALLAKGVSVRLVLTGQHPDLRPGDYGMPVIPVLDLGCAGLPDPNAHANLVARRITDAIADAEVVVVQGDTSSALGGAMGAVEAGIAVAHVEAGLRSHDRLNFWPEEDFRISIDRAASLLFAPTDLNAANLRREELRGAVSVTGNTGIDALIGLLPMLRIRRSSDGKRRLLVTCHRRESWTTALGDIASCLTAIGRRNDVAITFVLHPNSRVAGEMVRLLSRAPNLHLRPPCRHVEMLQLMRNSDLIMSDSGGMQEEAPALGVPLLILRDRTERPEGIASGNAILVGRNGERIRAVAETLLDTQGALQAMSRPSFPYGDGNASSLIAEAIATFLSNKIPRIRPAEPRSPSPLSSTAQAAP